MVLWVSGERPRRRGKGKRAETGPKKNEEPQAIPGRDQDQRVSRTLLEACQADATGHQGQGAESELTGRVG